MCSRPVVTGRERIGSGALFDALVVCEKDTITQLTEKIRAEMTECPELANNPRFSALFTEKRCGQGSKHAAPAP